MAEETQDIPHFNISAAVVRQLGEQLVSDEVTALMELVKNSYDADAKWVRVEIDTKHPPLDPALKFTDSKSYILIEDNGFGMNESEIKNGWMVISLSAKRKMKVNGETTPLGRTPLGDKGLGRLSTQKLGNQLEMLTSKMDESVFHHVSFKWSDFSDDRSLTNVPVKFESYNKTNWKKGTKLFITDLKDKSVWEKGAIDKIKGQLSQLLFPFKEKRPFQVYLKIDGADVDLDELNINVRNQAVAQYEFKLSDEVLSINGTVKLLKLRGNDSEGYRQYIDPDAGKDFVSFLSDHVKNKKYFLSNVLPSKKEGVLYSFDITAKIAEDLLFERANGEIAHPGKFYGEIDEFDLRGGDSLESAFDNLAQFKLIVKNQVGIRIFRDGFGIKPYGLNGNDWLRLGSSQTHGNSFYGLRPNNIIGFVALTAKENKDLKEKTDREGFIEDAYAKNFIKVMDFVTSHINEMLESTRRSYNEYKSNRVKEKGDIKSVTASISRIKSTSQAAKKLKDKSVQVKQNLKKVSSSVKAAIANVESLKTQESVEQHKLLKDIMLLLEEAELMLSDVNNLLNDAQKLGFDAEYLEPKINDLETQINEFAELAGLGLTAEALSHEIMNIGDRLLDQSGIMLKRAKPNVSIEPVAVFAFVEYVNSAVKALRKQMSHLAPSLKYVREQSDKLSIDLYVEELREFYNEKYDGYIEVNTIQNGHAFTVEANKGKLTQVFDNLIINSEYWLKERRKQERAFFPVITIEISNPFIRIYDNGWGVDPNVEDRIFQPFITAKPKGVGRGLGLFIIQQLLDTIGCDISLLSQRNVNNRRYIFQINLSSIIK